jgi:hypothetical protein
MEYGTGTIPVQQCCGSGMFYPGSRIRIPNFYPGSGSRISDPGSRILLYIKIGMKNKTNFFLAF